MNMGRDSVMIAGRRALVRDSEAIRHETTSPRYLPHISFLVLADFTPEIVLRHLLTKSDFTLSYNLLVSSALSQHPCPDLRVATR